VAVKFALERKVDQMGAGNAPPGISLEDILSMVQNGVEETRRIMTNLRPSILDDLGIMATVNWFCREFQKVYPHFRIERRIEIQEQEVPEGLKIVIFRILQEAMNNIAKHSQGKAVVLALEKKNEGDLHGGEMAGGLKNKRRAHRA
jgi:signal transduction histidine kinase